MTNSTHLQSFAIAVVVDHGHRLRAALRTWQVAKVGTPPSGSAFEVILSASRLVGCLEGMMLLDPEPATGASGSGQI